MANFAQDSQTENWLKQRGVPFTYRTNLRLKELVPNWETVNQGRPDGASKDETLIEKYMFSMREGAIFPAPIVARAADGLECLDGIQRLSAAALNDQTIFNAYEILSDNPSLRASIRVCANSILNGTSPSIDWTISRIVDILHDQYKMSPMDCAVWSGVSPEKINQEISARLGAAWMESHGINIARKPANQKGFRAVFAEVFSPTMRERLKRELPEIVGQIQDMKANNNEAEELIRTATDFKPRKDMDLGLQLRERWQEVISRPDIKARIGGRRKRHPVEHVKMALAAAVTIMQRAVDDDQHADEEQSIDIVQFTDQIKHLARKIVPKDNWGALAYGPRRE